VGPIRRRAAFGTVLALTLALTATGCGVIAERSSPATLRVGYDTLDGDLHVWPPRGSLAGDTEAVDQVTAAVEKWRTPTDELVHLASSGILWLGEVDGARLALVAANVPGTAASWLLQLTGQGSSFEVVHAVEYTDPGYLVYSDVLPVWTSDGRRYLTSARVERLIGPDGQDVPVTDGLSAPVNVPGCSAVSLTAELRRTESLSDGPAEDRLLDLGTAIDNLGYPLVRDESGSGAEALAGLDTCALTRRTGPFGSEPRRGPSGERVERLPQSWPLDRLAARTLAEVSLGQGLHGRLDQLTWHTTAGVMSAVVYRPAGGQPVLSRADRANPLQMHVLQVTGQPYVVLVWTAGADARLSLPSGTPTVIEEPGVVVLRKTSGKQTYILSTPYGTHERSLTDRDVEKATAD
jgi:hypothetical protein